MLPGSTSKSDTLCSDSDTSSAKEMDSTVDSQSETSDTEHRASTQDAGRSTTQNIQEQILKELQRVNSRLEVVENKVAETSTTTQGPKDTLLSDQHYMPNGTGSLSDGQKYVLTVA